MKRRTATTTKAQVNKLLGRFKDGLVKIDLGGGYNPQAGFLSMDIQGRPGVDVVHDWNKYPWPFPSNCATIVMASHVAEHVNPADFGFIKWMNEIWRVLKYDGQLIITVPYAGSPGYWADPTHINPCTQHTWRYFDPEVGNGTGSDKLWDIYKPKPWRIRNCYFHVEGNMEVLLEKRRGDYK